MTELHEAVASENFDLVDKILKKGLCDPNSRDMDWSNRTALHWAAAKGHSKIIKLLVGHGARLCLRTEAGWTPVHFAAESGRLGALRTLHTLHAPMDATDLYGDTPKRIAEIYGHKDCVRFLEIAEEQYREYCQIAKLKGDWLEEEDEDRELKKEEVLKKKPYSRKKHPKKFGRKDGIQTSN